MSSFIIGSRKFVFFAMVFIILLSVTLLPSEAVMHQASKEQGCTIKNGLIILVDFPDVKHDVKRHYAEERFFKQLNDYVKEMSYGSVCIGGDVTKNWHTMPDSISKYKISSRNLEVDKSRIEKLLHDAIDAVDKDTDFSKYDFTAIFMGAKFSEYGMIGLCGYPGMLGWSSSDTLKTKSGQLVKGGIAIFSYQAHSGTLFHDVAHILGGVKDRKRLVPCLYDHDLQAKPGNVRETFLDATINMGLWDAMSCHYNKFDMPPPGISIWTKIRLNFISPSKIRTVKPGETAEVILPPVEQGTHETLAIRIPLSASTYYLIENRHNIGFDKNIPGNGILIMYADDDIAECRHGKSPVRLINASPEVPRLDGAAFDIGKKDSFIDKENGLKIQLIDKKDSSYRIRISPYPEKGI